MEVKLAEHPCNQEKVLATMCEQLRNIECDIREIKDIQNAFMQSTNALMMDIAKRPTPENMAIALSKLDKHDTYFKLFGTALVVAWGLIIFLVDKVWK